MPFLRQRFKDLEVGLGESMGCKPKAIIAQMCVSEKMTAYLHSIGIQSQNQDLVAHGMISKIFFLSLNSVHLYGSNVYNDIYGQLALDTKMVGL